MGCLQQEQRKEQERLVAGDEPDKTPLVAGLPDGERQDGDADVGVQALVVGVAMVKVVLGDPPAEAHPDPQVGVDQAGQVVAAPGTEDLPVAGVVAHERALGEDDRQVGGGDQLPRGVAEDGEGGPPASEQGQVEADLGGVPGAPAIKQPGLLDLPGELGVLTPPARR